MTALAVQDLTEKQAAFVRHIANGLKQGEAARLAGFVSPDTQAVRLVRLPGVAKAIRQELERKAEVDLAPRAWSALSRMLDDMTIPAAVRLAAIKTALDRAGYTEKRNQNNGLDKPLGEMTAEELLAKAGEIRGRLAAREAHSAPNSAPILDATGQEPQEA